MSQAIPTTVLQRRPLYPTIVSFPIAFFGAALLTDVAYWITDGVEWETFSIWLITAGLVVAAVAAVTGVIDLARHRRTHVLTPSWPRVFGDFLAVVLELINAFVHSRDGYTAVVPTGIILSVLSVLILIMSRQDRPYAVVTPVVQGQPVYGQPGYVQPGYTQPTYARGRGVLAAMLSLVAFVAGLAAVWALAGPVPAPMEPATQYGANVPLPAPHQYLLPPMNVAPKANWGSDIPTVANGLQIKAFGEGLEHPRSLYVLPNGDVLVVESSGPTAPIHRPKDFIMGWIEAFIGARATAPNRITLIRDTDGDGVPEQHTVFLDHLHSPFGVALVGNDLYVADTDAIMHYTYTEGETSITTAGTKLLDLPGGPIDHHWTKSLVASADGTKLYVGVGSNSNIMENGLGAELDRADILEVDRKTGAFRIFASGLRNPNGLQFEPTSGKLWAVVNERDELGPNLVPDYLTSVQDGGFYGWPYSYYGQHLDPRVQPQRPDLVATAIVPDYALSSHVAPLGLVFNTGTALPDTYKGGAFVGEHGSWDRTPLNGYKVIYIPFTAGHPSGPPVDIVTGFLDPKNHARGRPVGLALDKSGALLIADDIGNKVWRVTAAAH